MSASVLTVIVNYKSAEMALKSAAAARRAMQGVNGAITIVDNDSQDGSYEVLARETADWPDVRVIASGRNGGFGFGNNIAIRAGLPDGRKPDFVYLLNPDAFPDADTITTLRDHLLAHPRMGFLGSAIRGEDGVAHHSAFRFPSVLSEFEAAAQTAPISRLLRRYQVSMDFPAQPCAVDWCSGASVMFRRAMLDQIGLFDEDFFLYFEETDLCRRAWAAGWQGGYLPQVSVMHIGSVSTGMKRWDRVPGYWFASRARYFTKAGGRAYLAGVTLAYLAGALIWKARRVLERKEERVPPYFLRDLAAHTWQALKPGATANRAGQQVQHMP